MDLLSQWYVCGIKTIIRKYLLVKYAKVVAQLCELLKMYRLSEYLNGTHGLKYCLQIDDALDNILMFVLYAMLLYTYFLNYFLNNI